MTLDPALKNLMIGWLVVSFPLIFGLIVAAATSEPIQIDKFRFGRRSSLERRLLLATALFMFVFSTFLFFFLYTHLKPVSPMNIRKKPQPSEINLKKSPPSPSAGLQIPEAKNKLPSNSPSQNLQKAPQVIAPAPRRAESRSSNRSKRIEPQPVQGLNSEASPPPVDLPGETGEPIGFPGVR